MRVVCTHPARDPVACGNGSLRIGSAPDDDIVPAGDGVDPHHVAIAADARGLTLSVRPGCRRVYVNARAVREKAVLRYGDTVTVGANRYLVATDSAPVEVTEALPAGASAGEAALRIVSGAASGQALAIAPELRLGAGSRHFGDIGYASRVTRAGGGLVFESESRVPRVNGWLCHRVRLSPGDQIVLDEHRLVVEAPGLQYAAHLASLPSPPAAAPVVEREDSPHTEAWWLIAAAAVLAAVIALFLY